MKTRVTSAIVLIVIACSCIFLSELTRVLFFCVAGIFCAYEFSRSVENLKVGCAAWVMYTYMAVQGIMTLLDMHVGVYVACFGGAVYLALFSGIFSKGVSGSGCLYTLAGVSYPCFPFVLLMLISASELWLEALLLGAASAWICDCFALFGGMRFGKHKLAPHISPNKTIEGSICGALSSVVTGLIVWLLFSKVENLTVFPLWVCILTALVSSTMGQIGDLVESLIKRMIGVKDFSNLIPGHGGVLDRFDSLLFSIPTTYLFLRIAEMYLL